MHSEFEADFRILCVREKNGEGRKQGRERDPFDTSREDSVRVSYKNNILITCQSPEYI